MNTEKQTSFSYDPVKESSVAGWVHVGALVCAILTSWLIGFAGMGVGLVTWVLQSDKKSIVAQNAAECFNFNFSMFVYAAIAVVFCILTLGIGLIVVLPLAFVFFLVWIVCSIKAAMIGFKGGVYRYPFSIRLVQ